MRADKKVLNFNKVPMKTHRRSGLLISNKLCGGDSTKSCFLRNHDF